MSEVLTLRELMNLAYVVQAAQKTAKVAWLDVDGDSRCGTARSVGDDQGNFLRADEDVREAYLRITTRSGMETFLPVAELAVAHGKREFMEYDW